MDDDKKCEECCGGGCETERVRAEEYLTGWKRALADYQNREKEFAREKQVIASYAAENTLIEILSILDNLKQAFRQVPSEYKETPWLKGIEQIIRQFENILKDHGVTGFSALGEKFDHTRHEAVGAGEGEEGTVIEEITAGYLAGDRLIRPSRVIVGKSAN